MPPKLQLLLRTVTLVAALLARLTTTTEAWTVPLPGGGRIRLDDGGVLRIQLQGRSDAPAFPPRDARPTEETLRSIEVRDTGTAKGYGAFCTRSMDRHTFLGFYAGTTIASRETLDTMVANGETTMDYVVSVDGGRTFLDGYGRSKDRSSFSPVFLNHADGGSEQANCMRLLEAGCVAFFTSRRVEAGEELCFDYGSRYWDDRESDKI